MDPTRARFPFPKGGYESFYLVAHHPSDPLAVWIRCTMRQRPGADPVGERWVTLFEPSGPTKLRTTGDLSSDNAWIRVGDATFLDGIAGGTTDDAAWDLSFSPRERPLLYLPSERMYRGGLPKTKPISLAPHARFNGSVRVGDRAFEVAGWRGMVGHNWGTEHAHRWVWVHSIFDEDSWIDVVAARIRIGPVTSPWIANGAITINGQRHTLGGIVRARSTTVDVNDTNARLQIPGDGVRVDVRIGADSQRFVTWDYAHPNDSGVSDVRNCSIADLEVTATLGTGSPRTLTVAGAASYELGSSA